MAISELNLFPNGTSSLTADKLREQLTSQFQPLLNKASPLDGPDKSEESEKTETTDSTQSAGQTQAPAEDPDEIAFKGSIQFRFALYQLNYANQCPQNAVNYMGQTEQIQDQAEEAAEMITKARDAEARWDWAARDRASDTSPRQATPISSPPWLRASATPNPSSTPRSASCR